MLKHKVVAFASFIGLVVTSKMPPTLGTASAGLLLAIVLALALVPLVRETLDEALG